MTHDFLKTSPGEDPIIVEALFPAPVERVFHAWTTPEDVIKWFGNVAEGLVSAEIDLHVGGRWRYVTHETEQQRSVLEGEYQEIEHNRRLKFTWTHVLERRSGQHERTATSQVTVDFVQEGEATRVHLVHEGIGTEDARRGVGSGWNDAFAHIHTLVARG